MSYWIKYCVSVYGDIRKFPISFYDIIATGLYIHTYIHVLHVNNMYMYMCIGCLV